MEEAELALRASAPLAVPVAPVGGDVAHLAVRQELPELPLRLVQAVAVPGCRVVELVQALAEALPVVQAGSVEPQGLQAPVLVQQLRPEAPFPHQVEAEDQWVA